MTVITQLTGGGSTGGGGGTGGEGPEGGGQHGLGGGAREGKDRAEWGAPARKDRAGRSSSGCP